MTAIEWVGCIAGSGAVLLLLPVAVEVRARKEDDTVMQAAWVLRYAGVRVRRTPIHFMRQSAAAPQIFPSKGLLIKALGQRIERITVDVSGQLGLGDPALTAQGYGALWAILETIWAVAPGKKDHRGVVFAVQLQPDYLKMQGQARLDVQWRLGALIAGLWAAYTMAKKKKTAREAS